MEIEVKSKAALNLYSTAFPLDDKASAFEVAVSTGAEKLITMGWSMTTSRFGEAFKFKVWDPISTLVICNPGNVSVFLQELDIVRTTTVTQHNFRFIMQERKEGFRPKPETLKSHPKTKLQIIFFLNCSVNRNYIRSKRFPRFLQKIHQ